MANRPEFVDLDLDFIMHPVTGDVSMKKGPQAIARSIRNLVFTGFFERPFRSYIGSNARKMLFELMGPNTEKSLAKQIEDTIRNFEPRISNVSVTVTSDPAGKGFNAKIIFYIENISEGYSLTTFISRVR